MVVGAFDRSVKAACGNILLDLAVPLIGHKLLEPLGKASKLIGRKAGNHRFKFFDVHGGNLLPEQPSEKKRLPNIGVMKKRQLMKPAPPWRARERKHYSLTNFESVMMY